MGTWTVSSFVYCRRCCWEHHTCICVDTGLTSLGSSWSPAWWLCCWGRQARLSCPRSSSRPKAMSGPLSGTQRSTKAQARTEDTLGHIPSPSWDPEPDRDDLYHPPPEEAQEVQDEAGLWSWALSLPQVLQGPEEDRDHIYHPREDSWGP
ncbi:proline-rich acidic protein 1 [Phoca vitulina]|uniref:proline-rich acidic protein 1 n=1 Tax=Phoca vitulina TaxID=9720 RepID=UPI001395E216|nr:proline-rich acidic protein 1 [Phoca vitulina]